MLLSSSNGGSETGLELIDSFGDFVHQYLKQFEGAEIHGQVHSVFHRCAYLEFDTILVCVALRELGPSSITLLFEKKCTTFPACFVQGSGASLSMKGLNVSGKHFYGSDDAHIFDSAMQPRTIDQQCLFALNQLIARLDLPDEGLASTLRPGVLLCEGESALMQYAKPAILALLASLPVLLFRSSDRLSDRLSQIENVKTSADVNQWVRLLGAGPGLTPSGDDFLSGILTALHLLGHSATAKLLWNNMAATARTSTNEISVALLEQAAAGRMSHKVSLLLKALLDDTSTSPARLRELLAQLGETSGWDWLAGFVLGLNTLLAVPESPYHREHSLEFSHLNSESPPVRVH